MITQTGTESELIYRQQAIDAIDKYSVWVMYTQGDSQKDEAEFVVSIIKQTKKAIQSMLIEDLPSAQPEIVRCKDCRWGREVCGNIECFVDRNIPSEYHGYEWFCPNGERRTDE